MDEQAEIERVKERLRQLMKARGIKAKPLSKKAGKGETYVRDMFDAEDLKVGTLHRIADALDASIGDIIGNGSVDIVGRIGAGGSVLYTEAPLGTAPRPPGWGIALEAMEVAGESMLPRFSSGDLVFISRDSRDGVKAEDVGEYCACRLTTGETYVKQLAYGSRPGFFTLRSLNAEDIVDVELDWATPIISVVPRAARRRLGF